jgi:hypothetical protein
MKVCLLRSLGAALLGLTFLSFPAAAQTTPPAQTISLTAYRDLLSEYEAGAARQGMSRAQATALRQRFQAILAVSCPDGHLVTVDNSREIATLDQMAAHPGRRADKEDATRIVLLNDLIAPPTAPLPPRGDAGALARQILAAREFKDAAAPVPPRTWWDDLMESIQKKIADFLNWLFGGKRSPSGKAVPGLAPFIVYTLYFLAAVGALIGLYYLARSLVEYRRTVRRRTGALAGLDLDELALPDPLASSRELAERGDYRGALRLAYIASLRRLAQAGLLVLQENRTNWEYQRSLRRRSTLAYDVLLPATRLFDAVWYGGRQATPAEYEIVVAAHDALPTAPAAGSTATSSTPTAAATAATTPAAKDGNPW